MFLAKDPSNGDNAQETAHAPYLVWRNGREQGSALDLSIVEAIANRFTATSSFTRPGGGPVMQLLAGGCLKPAGGYLHGSHHPFQPLAHLAGECGDGRLANQFEHRIGVHEFHADVAIGYFAHKHVTWQ